MRKKHAQAKETPFGHTFMRKKRAQVKETPYRYTSMRKKRAQVKEKGHIMRPTLITSFFLLIFLPPILFYRRQYSFWL